MRRFYFKALKKINIYPRLSILYAGIARLRPLDFGKASIMVYYLPCRSRGVGRFQFSPMNI